MERLNSLAGGELTWNASGLSWAVLCGLVALVLLVILYREECKLVRPITGFVLLGLRLTVVILLTLTLFEPTWVQSRPRAVSGTVLVGLDLSASMDLTDPGRDPERSQALAELLNLGADQAVTSLSRLEIMSRLMSDSWLARIDSEHRVELFGFARKGIGLDRDLISNADPIAELFEPSQRAETRLDLSLRQAGSGREDRDLPIGVILLTDGLHNGPENLYAALDPLVTGAVPVTSVLIGSERLPRDAAVVSIEAPSQVLRGDLVTIVVLVKLDRLVNSPVEVQLQSRATDGTEQQIVKTIRAQQDRERQEVRLTVALDQLGEHNLSVEVSAGRGDRLERNNRRSTTIQVVDQTLPVLLAAQRPHWEFRYLRNAWNRDDRIDLEVILANQPELATTGGTTVYERSLVERAAGTNQADLDQFTLVAVCDFDPGDQVWPELERYVSAGGTLVVMAGGANWPENTLRSDPLRRLLPVTSLELIQPRSLGADPLHAALPSGLIVQPTEVALANSQLWPMFHLTGDPSENRLLWSGLPGQTWCLPGQLKPAATSLAILEGIDQIEVGLGPSNSNARAVIAAQAYGRGKVLYLGIPATWRWRHRVGDAYHHRFWSQVVRWAAEEPLSVGNRWVRFGPESPRVELGQSVQLVAQVLRRVPGLEDPDTLLAARVFSRVDQAMSAQEREPVALVPLTPRLDQANRFTGTLADLPPGSYDLQLVADDLEMAAREAGEPALPLAKLQVFAPPTQERIELASDRSTLDLIAQATGGQVLDESQVRQIPSIIRQAIRESVQTDRETTTLWDHPVSLLLMLSLVGTEWMIRRRSGLM